ncbi:hypothetical protein [Nocardia terpenica]|uniref:Uncharacterized protein n=1 Tax=Nocardia terpenica TaxID=455432 RepID=A0A6G9ZE47_9NOCA|nr:hypothetical protein [Nocardia terpenica]QIS23681.1 hypothetical protein F6W96_40815 [Nocardia terpenica]
MSRTRDEQIDAVHAEIIGEHGSLGDYMAQLRPDWSAGPVELPTEAAETDEVVVSLPVTLRLPAAAADRLRDRATEAGTELDELVSRWVTLEAEADDTPITRDELLAALERAHHRRSA